MSNPPSTTPGLREWLPALSAAVLILGAISSVGGVISSAKDSARRVDQLEEQQRKSEEKYQQILERLSRIEGKIDTPSPSQGERGRR